MNAKSENDFEHILAELEVDFSINKGLTNLFKHIREKVEEDILE
ncbi:MAG: hypothetical protein U5N85_07550 [Arcicella sp.]|nr:hypothetical protein [Arcicella sp.]